MPFSYSSHSYSISTKAAASLAALRAPAFTTRRLATNFHGSSINPPPPPRRRYGILALGVCLGATGSAGAFFWYLERRDEHIWPRHGIPILLLGKPNWNTVPTHDVVGEQRNTSERYKQWSREHPNFRATLDRLERDPAWYQDADERTKIEIEKLYAEEMLNSVIGPSNGKLRYVVDSETPQLYQTTPHGAIASFPQDSTFWRIERTDMAPPHNIYGYHILAHTDWPLGMVAEMMVRLALLKNVEGSLVNGEALLIAQNRIEVALGHYGVSPAGDGGIAQFATVVVPGYHD